jgi:hypothetical protein
MASIARAHALGRPRGAGRRLHSHARAKGLSEMWVVAKHTLQERRDPDRHDHGTAVRDAAGRRRRSPRRCSRGPGSAGSRSQSITNRDYPVVQCTVFAAALLFIVINFVVDLLYGFLDPRIRAH